MLFPSQCSVGAQSEIIVIGLRRIQWLCSVTEFRWNRAEASLFGLRHFWLLSHFATVNFAASPSAFFIVLTTGGDKNSALGPLVGRPASPCSPTLSRGRHGHLRSRCTINCNCPLRGRRFSSAHLGVIQNQNARHTPAESEHYRFGCIYNANVSVGYRKQK